MSRRAHHEKQIRFHDDWTGAEFDKALTRVINRHGGLGFFTDDQIAEIRADMIQREWDVPRRIRNRNRRLRAA